MYRHHPIDRLHQLLLALLGVLLMGCVSHDGDRPSRAHEGVPTVLTVHVYVPALRALSRAAGEQIAPTQREATLSSLQLWVFRHADGGLVGYLRPTDTSALSAGTGARAEFQMLVDEDFADHPEAVDVFVLANVEASTCGLQFDETTTRAQLLAATLTAAGGVDAFGVSSPVVQVPAEGLPMSGCLMEQEVTGQRPVLQVSATDGALATVQLRRAVSKLRFVFARSTDFSRLSIHGITLDAGCLPESMPLLSTTEQPVGTSPYVSEPASLLPSAFDDVASCPYPVDYAYHENMTAQQYDDLIAQGVKAGALTDAATYYLRESDQPLSGTISYSIDEGSEQRAPFQMTAGETFRRNSEWVVYSYVAYAKMEVQVMRLTPWTPQEESYNPHNW